MNLPNLFIPGAGKSGTSSLHEYLKQHPDIFMSEVKEPHFFSHDSRFYNGREEYSKLFESAAGVRYRGESSTGYMAFPKVVERIKKEITRPKFIFVLRNPIDRAYSHYRWLQGMGFEDASFKDALLRDWEEEPDLSRSIGPGYKFYYQLGLYAKWLSRYLDMFGFNNIHIITTEALRTDPLGTLNSCFSFLGLHPLNSIQSVTVNKSVVLKYPRLYKTVIMFGSGYAGRGIIRTAKIVLSKGLRRNLTAAKAGFFSSLKEYSSTNFSTQPLSNDLRKWLAGFYVDDVAKLREITKIAFREWDSDFPLPLSEIMFRNDA